ncbi:hypothetical protein N9S30_00675, partial [bacterium]|nr:hypothetical protein [bacterium]
MNGQNQIFVLNNQNDPHGCTKRPGSGSILWQYNEDATSPILCDASGIANCECKSIADEYDCAFVPDVTNLGGTLDGQCNQWCDVWATGSSNYDEIVAMNFLNGEPIVFVSEQAKLASACHPIGISTANFGWSGSGGWGLQTFTALDPPESVFSIDSIHAQNGNRYMEFRDSTNAGLGSNSNCHISYQNPRICRAGPKTILQLGIDVGLDCPLVGPVNDAQGTGACADTATYNTLSRAATALAANRNSGDASCHSITFISDPARTNLWFRLHASDTTSPLGG